VFLTGSFLRFFHSCFLNQLPGDHLFGNTFFYYIVVNYHTHAVPEGQPMDDGF